MKVGTVMKQKEKLLADINKISRAVNDLYFEMNTDVNEENVFEDCAIKALYNYTSIRNLRILKKYAQHELDRLKAQINKD